MLWSVTVSTRVSGVCYALFAYDIGLAIDLDACERRIAESASRARIRHRRRAPRYFEYRPAPLRVTAPAPSLPIGACATAPAVDSVLYDFGAVSVSYAIPLDGALESLTALAEALYDNETLLGDSRQRVADLTRSIAPAVSQPGVTDLVEDYLVYHLVDFPPIPTLQASRELLAGILRSEPGPLSAQEIDDALSAQLAYTPADLAIVDWHASIVAAHEADDILAVLEFANVELLEGRFIDERLDQLLDRAHAAASRRRWRQRLPLLDPLSGDLRRLAALQTDSALLYEAVNNALKLLGDPYLARLYRMTAQRLHLPQWDASILRKLQTAESIYQKLSDERSARRLEWLEWIVIALIAFEVAMSLAGAHS
jgi:hypothetical protein